MFPSEQKQQEEPRRRIEGEGSARPRYAETRAKAFRGLRFDWKFSQVRGSLGSDWLAPVERKFFPNDQAEVVTVNLAQPSPPPPSALLRPHPVFRAPATVFIGWPRKTMDGERRGGAGDNERNKEGRRSITRGNGIDAIDRYAPRSQLICFA